MSYLTLIQLLNESVRKYNERDFCVIHEDHSNIVEKRISYSQLENQVKRYQSLLIKETGPVVIYLDTSPEWVVSFFSVASCSRTAVIVDTHLPPDMLLNQIISSQATTIITENSKQSQLKRSLKMNKKEFSILTIEELIKQKPFTKKISFPAENDIALIIFSSGSVDKPKGVVHTHLSVCNAIKNSIKSIQPPKDCNYLAFPPFFHILGLTCSCLASIEQGCCLVFIKSIKPTIMVNAIKKHKISIIIAPPVFYESLYKKIIKRINDMSWYKKYFVYTIINFGKFINLFSIKIGKLYSVLIFKKIRETLSEKISLLISGGAPIDEDSAKGLCIFGFNLRHGYGMTETCGAICATDPFDVRNNAVGKPIENTKIITSSLNKNGVGEILIKSNQNMLGYYDNGHISKDAFTKGGWLRSGDLGYFRNNYLYVRGRKKEVIVTEDGKKIYPVDLEKHFNDLNEIKELCVFGLSRDNHTEAAIVVVVNNDKLFEERSLILKNQIKAKNSSLPNFMQIKHIFVETDELPKTSLKKIKRTLVAETYKKCA